MVKMAKEIVELLGDLTASKAMTTCDTEGNLNVVPIGSLDALDEETLVFADLFGQQTRTMKNLDTTKKVAVTAFKPTPSPHLLLTK